MVFVNNHDPVHLNDEFEIEYAGGFGLEYLERSPRDRRIRITKLPSSPPPRVLWHTAVVTADGADPDESGFAWNVPINRKEIDHHGDCRAHC